MQRNRGTNTGDAVHFGCIAEFFFRRCRGRRLQEFSETGTRIRESARRDLNAERLQLVKDPAGCRRIH